MTALLLALGMVAPGPWQLGGPGGGGWIQTVCYSPHDPNTIFVGCDVGGFYVSTDGGRHWSIQNTGLRDPWVEVIVPHPTDPQTLYVGTRSGVHRSDDGGQRWQLLRQGFPPKSAGSYSAPIGSLVLDPRNPDTLYAGIGEPRHSSRGQGALYRSDDRGASWRLLTPPGTLPAKAMISSILPRPDGSLLIATQHGLFASADTVTWTACNRGLDNLHTRFLASCASRPEVLYVTVQATPGKLPWDGGVYRSDDGGATWRRVSGGLKAWAKEGDRNLYMTCQYDRLVVDPNNPELVYLGGRAWVNAGMYRTTNGGQSWEEILQRPSEGKPGNVEQGYITFWGPSVECLAMQPQDSRRLVFGTSGHVIESTDGGGSWHALYTEKLGEGWNGNGLEVTCLWTMECHPTRPGNWLLGYMDIGLWQTTDGGRSVWRSMIGVDRKHVGCALAYAYDPDDPDLLWGGFGEWGANHGALYESRDAGRSWSPLPGLPDGQIKRVVPDPSSPRGARRLWVAVRGSGLFEGTPGGDWTRLEGLSGELADLDLVDGRLLALVDGSDKAAGGLYVRDGAAWRRLDRQPVFGTARELASSPAAPGRLFVAARSRHAAGQLYPGGCYRSTDGGQTWQRVFDNHFVNAVAVHPTAPETVVIGGTDHPYHDEAMGCGVWLSRDGGETWQDITANLSLPNISVLRFDPTDPQRLLVGTGGNSFFWRALP